MLALFADLHANLEALQACLQHAHDRGARRFAFLGDLVGYGADPQAVVDLVRRCAGEGALVIQGNHDASVVGSSSGMGQVAQDGVLWTREVLSAEAKEWLRSLPLIVREGDACFVHASAAAPGEWEYVDNPGAARKSADASGVPWTFSGHVHQQKLFFEAQPGKMSSFDPVAGSAVPVPARRRWLAIVGSVGQPRERNPAAAYALFDRARESLTFVRVPYDHALAARKIRAAGLADTLTWTGRR